MIIIIIVSIIITVIIIIFIIVAIVMVIVNVSIILIMRLKYVLFRTLWIVQTTFSDWFSCMKMYFDSNSYIVDMGFGVVYHLH